MTSELSCTVVDSYRKWYDTRVLVRHTHNYTPNTRNRHMRAHASRNNEIDTWDFVARAWWSPFLLFCVLTRGIREYHRISSRSQIKLKKGSGRFFVERSSFMPNVCVCHQPISRIRVSRLHIDWEEKYQSTIVSFA